jgi:outer membrane protein TolC
MLLSNSLCFDVAKAQQRSSSVALNWQECIQWLEKNNSELRSAKESLKRAQQEERLAFSGYLPTLSVNLSRDRIFKPSYESPDTSYEAYLELNQNLFSGFADQYKMKQI